MTKDLTKMTLGKDYLSAVTVSEGFTHRFLASHIGAGLNGGRSVVDSQEVSRDDRHMKTCPQCPTFYSWASLSKIPRALKTALPIYIQK